MSTVRQAVFVRITVVTPVPVNPVESVTVQVMVMVVVPPIVVGTVMRPDAPGNEAVPPVFVEVVVAFSVSVSPTPPVETTTSWMLNVNPDKSAVNGSVRAIKVGVAGS